MPLPFLTFFLPMILMGLVVLPIAIPLMLIRSPEMIQDAWQRIQEILQTTDWEAVWALIQEIFAEIFAGVA